MKDLGWKLIGALLALSFVLWTVTAIVAYMTGAYVLAVVYTVAVAVVVKIALWFRAKLAK